MSVTVVPATVEHLPWLRLLFSELMAEQNTLFPMPYPQIGGDEDLDAFTVSVYRSLGLDDTGIFVAVDGARVIGFLGGEILTRTVGLPRRFGHAHYLYVSPSYRKQGIARGLIEMGVAWTLSRGATMVECYGLAGDTSWERRGFHPMLTRYYVSTDELQQREQPEPVAPAPKVVRRKPRRRAQMNGHAVEA